MFSAIIVLMILPFLNRSKVRSGIFRPLFALSFWFLSADFLLLGWVGQKPVETPYIEAGMLGTVFYFLFLLIFLPLVGVIESKLASAEI